MTPARTQYLVDAAEKLAQVLPADQRDRFKIDYIKVMSSLNETVDANMEELEIGVTELLVAFFPEQPGPVNETTLKIVNDVRNIAYLFHTLMAGVDVASIRQLIYSSVQKALAASYQACQQNDENIRDRTSRTKELC